MEEDEKKLYRATVDYICTDYTDITTYIVKAKHEDEAELIASLIHGTRRMRSVVSIDRLDDCITDTMSVIKGRIKEYEDKIEQLKEKDERIVEKPLTRWLPVKDEGTYLEQLEESKKLLENKLKEMKR